MKRLFLLTLFLLSFGWIEADDVPAFPGAEGFARYTTTGGRGGSVYHVTTLSDTSSKGSLRYGLESLSGTRTIVFDVSGYIDLRSDLTVKKGNVTIAGQTAPGDGITIRYYTVNFTSTDNVIVRFIRFRRSQIKDVNDGADAAWGRNHKNIIFDHCSFSWSIDEIASFYDNQNFTMQWCTLGEALANPGHSKGEHSYGGIWGGKGASFHHNFLCHMQNRMPRFNGARYMSSNYNTSLYESTVDAERVDFRNCVMYNWGTGGCYGGPGGGYINMINNYYKKGPGTKTGTRVTQVTVGASGNSTQSDLYGYCSRYYINGNYVTAAGSNAANYDWNGVVYDDGLTTIGGQRYMADASHYYGSKVTYVTNNNKDYISVKIDEAIDAGEVTTHTAQEAYNKVRAYAGASLSRDAIDARYMEEARTGTATYTGATSQRAGILDLIQDPASVDESSKEQAYYPELKAETRPSGFDSDNDGMPDEWEEANGLNKNSNDAAKYTLDEKGWYTNLECYLNWLVQSIVQARNADAISSVEEYYPSLPIDETDLSVPESEPVIRSVEYYSLDGNRLSEPADGICIRVILYRDGMKSVEKVIKR